MYPSKANLHLGRACLFPGQLQLWIPQKCIFGSQCLQSYPSHRNVIAKKYTRMSAAPSILLISICCGSLFLIPKPLQQMLPFHIRAGKMHIHTHTHPSANATWASGNQSHFFFFFFLSQEWLCEGVHTHDMRAEADVHTWIRMSQEMPTEMSQNTRKRYLMICVCLFVFFSFYTVITPTHWPSWVPPWSPTAQTPDTAHG